MGRFYIEEFTGRLLIRAPVVYCFTNGALECQDRLKTIQNVIGAGVSSHPSIFVRIAKHSAPRFYLAWM